jgi:hypothetical protein
VRALFTCTLFLSAALLFLVQPLVARLVLPLLGGTPAVWNTCMVFFQAALLAGYTYAHVAPTRLGIRRHALVHLGVLLVPLLVLPIAVPRAYPAPDSNHPIAWLLGVLALAVGLPFFAVSTSGPLLQRWFAASGDPAADDPYFLYAASNLGSLLALLAYPFLLEPTLRLTEQARLWQWGYFTLVALTAACALALRRTPGKIVDASHPVTLSPRQPVTSSRPNPVTPSNQQRTHWALLAFVPSSLMLSVTTYLTTDIAAVPLLWVLPLSIYLLTFVLAFARRPLPLAGFVRWMPVVVLTALVIMLTEATEPLFMVVALHLLLLFWIGMVCHGALAADRPAAAHLTEFYLWLSFGGVLGGLFNGLVAPLVFNAVTEYPLVLILACLLMPAQRSETVPPRTVSRFDFLIPAALGVLALALIYLRSTFAAGIALGPPVGSDNFERKVVRAVLGVPPGPGAVAFVFLLPLVGCYLCSRRPVRFGLAVGAVLLAWTQYEGVAGRTLHRERSFFGAHRVTLDAEGAHRVLLHGNTVHGMQGVEPSQAREPLTYYYRTGPAGKVFTHLQGDPRLRRVGLVGLGAGALACYASAGEHWTFFEIDPAVLHIAQHEFTYLTSCPAQVDFVLGDARLTLARSSDRFGVLVIDAFSSDAIPMHLLTREALAIYRNHLEDNGLILFNVSNRYLDLPPVLAALAQDAGMIATSYEDRGLSDRERRAGKSPSHWVLLAYSREAAAGIGIGWGPVRPRRGTSVWTDDYSNLFSVMKWKKDED